MGAFLYPGTVQRGRATTLLFLAQLVKIFPRLSHKITQNTNHLMSSGAWGRGIGEADEREVGSVSEGRGAAGAGILGPGWPDGYRSDAEPPRADFGMDLG